MIPVKWKITTQERNALVEAHLGCIWWTINKIRRLISAVGLEDDDVFQQLAVRMIRVGRLLQTGRGLRPHTYPGKEEAA